MAEVAQAVQKHEISLRCDDGAVLSAVRYAPQQSSAGVVIFAAALGVPQYFYRKLACFLAEQGFSAITFDYRGCGESKNFAAAKAAGAPVQKVQLVDWARQDLKAAIQFATQLQAGPVFVAGHSIGGQLVALADNADRLAGIVGVAASFPWLHRWPLPQRWMLSFNFNLLIPMLASLRSRFPAQRVGLGAFDLPSSIMLEWARWIRRDDYLLDPRFGIDAAPFGALSLPLLAFGFADDSMVPRASYEKLLAVYRNCEIERRYLDPAQRGMPEVGHMGFFREQHRETLWREMLDWLRARS